jgi:hypothetical protein
MEIDDFGISPANSLTPVGYRSDTVLGFPLLESTDFDIEQRPCPSHHQPDLFQPLTYVQEWYGICLSTRGRKLTVMKPMLMRQN